MNDGTGRTAPTLDDVRVCAEGMERPSRRLVAGALGFPTPKHMDRRLPDAGRVIRRVRLQQDRDLWNGRREGQTWEELAEGSGMGLTGVREAVLAFARREGGLSVPHVPHWDPARKHRALALRRAGLAWKDVAERLGYAEASVAKMAARRAAAR